LVAGQRCDDFPKRIIVRHRRPYPNLDAATGKVKLMKITLRGLGAFPGHESGTKAFGLRL